MIPAQVLEYLKTSKMDVSNVSILVNKDSMDVFLIGFIPDKERKGSRYIPNLATTDLTSQKLMELITRYNRPNWEIKFESINREYYINDLKIDSVSLDRIIFKKG